MMGFAEFCVGKSVQVVGVNGVEDMVGEAQRYESIRQRFGQQAQHADVIYYYCSEQSEWDMGMGSEGYLLVRDGEIVDEVVLRMN